MFTIIHTKFKSHNNEKILPIKRVNINAADKFVNFISRITSKKEAKEYQNRRFCSVSNLPKGIKPKIVACTDREPKLKLTY